MKCKWDFWFFLGCTLLISIAWPVLSSVLEEAIGDDEGGHDTKLRFKYPIDGLWENELGSVMLVAAEYTGELIGVYKSTEGTPPGSGFFVLRGTHTFAYNGTTFGFSVSWDLPGTMTTTSWSGQYLEASAPAEEEEESSSPTLVTTWTLVSATEPGNAWQSTLVGTDTFRRKRLDPVDLLTLRLGAITHAAGRDFAYEYMNRMQDSDDIYDE